MSAALLIACQTVQAPARDYVHRSTSGLMSIGLDIFIDLDTGIVRVRSSPVGLGGSHWHKSSRRLTSQQLASFKETVRRALIEGPMSKQCIEEDEVAKKRGGPPIDRSFNDDDGMSSLDVNFEGRSGSVVDGICESPAFRELDGVAFNLGNF